MNNNKPSGGVECHYCSTLSRSDPIGESETNPGCSDSTISLYQKHAKALHFSWHKRPFKYAEAFFKGVGPLTLHLH